MGFLRCAVYAAVVGVLSFLLGRILPDAWFHADRCPFRTMKWEKNGAVYNTVFHIRKWQARVPDMSRICPGMMQAKKISRNFRDDLPKMITETCIAEWIHGLLCILALPLLWLWPGWGGVLFTVIYIFLGNLPFILIQRYNRPRLVGLQARLDRKHHGKED